MQQSGFDHIAVDYDRQFTQTALGKLQRKVVYRYLESVIQPGMRILELNCGTGEDALWLAQRGYSILATDRSSEMVALTRDKAKSQGLSHLIKTEVLDIRSIKPIQSYDLVFSNFGGLNCLSPDALQQFSKSVNALLQAEGVFVAIIMGQFCWWETLYFACKGQFKKAARRWNGGPIEAPLSATTSIPTWYHTPAGFRQLFQGLQVKTIQPVGFWLPPSYLNPLFSRWPQILEGLHFLEKKCRGRLWAFAADHFLIVLQKE